MDRNRLEVTRNHWQLSIFMVYFCSVKQADPDPHQHSVLWNAMIYPFLNMTIKGAIWYQGEANAGVHIAAWNNFLVMILWTQ